MTTTLNTKMDAALALTRLRGFIGPAQLRAFDDGRFSEERQYFFDTAVRLAGIIDTMPKTYEQDGLGDQAIASLHYFLGGCDWYITEKDAEAPDSLGQHQAFGWADLGGGGELGYISLVELLANGAELDFHFRPCTIAALKAAGKITR